MVSIQNMMPNKEVLITLTVWWKSRIDKKMDRTYKILKTINLEMEKNTARWNKQFSNLDHIALLVTYKPNTEDTYKRVGKERGGIS